MSVCVIVHTKARQVYGLAALQPPGMSCVCLRAAVVASTQARSIFSRPDSATCQPRLALPCLALQRTMLASCSRLDKPSLPRFEVN